MVLGNSGTVYGRWSDRLLRRKTLQGEQLHVPDRPSSSNKTGSVSNPLFDDKELSWAFLPQETTASKIRKVMSLELAMSRDLAYRKKVDNLEKETPIEFHGPPLVIQGPSSSARNVGIKREAPSDNLLCVTAPCQTITTELPMIVCEECQVPCSSEFVLRQHRQGKRHKQKLEELRRGWKITTEVFICELCKIRCMNEVSYREHLKGRKHSDCLRATSYTKVPQIEWEGELMLIE